MNTIPRKSILRSQRGIVLPLVAVLLFVFLGFAAFAIDFGHLYVVRNQLQNAADAAALAGAAVLYENPVVIDHVQVFDTAGAVTNLNHSGGKSVPPPNIEIGHYQFPSQWDEPGIFTPAQSYVQMTGWQDQTFSSLNSNALFINAVRATVSRDDVPRFFSGIFGSSLLESRTQAIAYVGFAGTLNPGDLDQPIAICRDAITDENGTLTCGVGRMLNSGNNEMGETAGWTNFTQPCETTTGNDVRTLVCGDGNENTLHYGQDMGTTGGVKPFGELYNCWKNNIDLNINADGYPTEPWSMTLAVIDCEESNNVGPCSELKGAVEINVVWINETLPQAAAKLHETAPTKMANWENNDPDGSVRWNSFVAHFGLYDIHNDRPATYDQKTIYFLPDCKVREAVGKTGGENYGVLAKHPVLVK